MTQRATSRTGFVLTLAAMLAGCTGYAQGPASQDFWPPSTGSAGPTYATDQRTCDRGALSNVFSTSTSSLLGSAAGAAAGGLLGSQFGKGSGNTLMTITGVLAGALAGGAIARAMDPVDQGCIDQALEHTPTNQTIAWQNPDGHASYWVTPTQTRLQDGAPCRDYIMQSVVDGRRDEATGAACRQPDGAWKQIP